MGRTWIGWSTHVVAACALHFFVVGPMLWDRDVSVLLHGLGTAQGNAVDEQEHVENEDHRRNNEQARLCGALVAPT